MDCDCRAPLAKPFTYLAPVSITPQDHSAFMLPRFRLIKIVNHRCPPSRLVRRGEACIGSYRLAVRPACTDGSYPAVSDTGMVRHSGPVSASKRRLEGAAFRPSICGLILSDGMSRKPRDVALITQFPRWALWPIRIVPAVRVELTCTGLHPPHCHYATTGISGPKAGQ